MGVKMTFQRCSLTSGNGNRCSREAAPGGKLCLKCCELKKEKRKSHVVNGMCHNGCKEKICDESRILCAKCHDLQKARTKKNRFTKSGNWSHRIRTLTRQVAIGWVVNKRVPGGVASRLSSKRFSWKHSDFVEKFGEIDKTKEIDHIIPLVCAWDEELFDEEFGKCVSNIGNISVVSKSDNSRKSKNFDSRIKDLCKSLRNKGFHGSELWEMLMRAR